MSHSPTANSQLRLLLLMILAATACGKSPPKQAGDADSAAFVQALERGHSDTAASPAVPKDLVPVALAAAQHECRTNGLICKDYEVSTEGLRRCQLTSADRANGYEDKWFVRITYLNRRDAREPWKDNSNVNTYLQHSGQNSGAWQVDAPDSPHHSSHPGICN